MNREDRVQFMLDRMRAAWQPEGDGVEADRRAFEAVASLFPEPEGVVEEAIQIGGVRAIQTTPTASIENQVPTVLYLHGGAFLIGSAAIYREQSARIARACGARVVTLDYRLAPEHPFPAAPDDTIAAYLELLESGTRAGSVLIAGDSAGGNLALGAAMRLRDGGLPIPAGLVLISPWVDLACTGETMETNADARHLAQRAGLLSSAATYLGPASAALPLASPILGNMANLPPMLIQVGSLETLLDDSRKLKRALDAAGTRAELHIHDGMVHEWHLMSALLPADAPLEGAEQAVDEIARFVREVTNDCTV